MAVEGDVKARFRVEAVAGEEEFVGEGRGRAVGVPLDLLEAPVGLEERHLAVGVVQVPFHRRAGRIDQGRDALVGIGAVIQGGIAFLGPANLIDGRVRPSYTRSWSRLEKNP